MQASRFAKPGTVPAEHVPKKPSISTSGANAVDEATYSRSATENTAAATEIPTLSPAKDETSTEEPEAFNAAESTGMPSVSREQSPEKRQPVSPAESKPLPPLPHVAELEKYQNLPEPPIILASSPGVTTPEIGPSTPKPTEIAAAAPPPLVAEPAKTEPELTPPVKTTESELVPPKSVSPALRSPTPAKARRSKAGKPCYIKLPKDKTKSYSGYPTPMSLDEFKARVDRFEKEGFDTRGFGHRTEDENLADEGSGLAQARLEYPDPTEQKQEREQRNFAISIPNKQLWDDYVNGLMEEKLRSLGVTSGDDEPSEQMSRQASSPFPALPLSPPIPSSSAASQHMWQNTMPFSAPFSPATSTNNTSIGPIASPAPSLGQQAHSSHMPRQSTFGFPFQSGPGLPYTGQQPWSPQPQQIANLSGPSRGMSPAMPAAPKRATSGFSHESPDSLIDRQPTPRGQTTSGQSLSRAEQATSWRSTSQPQQVQDTNKDGEEKAMDEGTVDPFTELASPKPQGHKHNISANLEREAENAQYYPGEYVNESRETSPSRATSAGAARDEASSHKPRPSHTSNASTSSRLNVAAKEFKFNPAAHHHSNFTMTTDALMPSPNKAARAADATSSVQLATAHSHQGSVSLSNLNVAAPEFKPPQKSNFAFSSSWFNFSAKKPTEGAKAAEAEKAATGEEKVPSIGSKIFGNIADIVKPTKKSKAVPIVDPKEVEEEKEDEFTEDRDGRLMPLDSRRKKGRFTQDDGDEVPRFAEPTPEPEPVTESTTLATAEHDLKASSISPSSDEENQQTLRPRPPPLALDYELDMRGNLSDGSDVPWHGIEGDSHTDERGKNSSAPEDLLTSPAPASGIEDVSSTRDSRGLSPETPSGRDRLNTSRNLGDDDSLLYPSFQELDAVMDYINKDNSDFGMEIDKPNTREENPFSDARPAEVSQDQIETSEQQRDVQTSPQHGAPQSESSKPDDSLANPIEEDTQKERSTRPSASPVRPGASPVRKLNKMAEGPVSDWDDMLSPGEELKIPQQNHLNDAHVATLVEGLLRRHLAPFEKQLKDLSASVKRPLAAEFGRTRPYSAYEKSESDADDEDDTDHGRQLRSRGETRSEKRNEQIRSAVMEAMAASQSDGFNQIEQEVKFRKAAENRADDLQRLLTLSEREIALLKESESSSEDKVRNLEQEQDDLRQRHRAVEEELRTKTLDFTAENAALESTLDEYRMSSTKWREEIDSVKHARTELEKTIQNLRGEANGNQREREELHGKNSKLEEELSTLTNTLMTERSTWERKDQRQISDIEGLQGKLTEAIQGKDRLDEEVSRLNQVERDSIKTAVTLEETQNAKSKLESMVDKFKEKEIEYHTIVARYEREASEAHENTSIQVERTKSLMQTDIDIANKQVENVRADLETRLEMIRSELENVRRDNDAVRSRYEKSLNEAVATRKEALQEATDTSKARLQEERKHFENSLNELSSQHDRALRNAIEDKQRSETHLNSSLKLAESKVSHLEDQVHSLEDRLSVAQSAAQAAAVAAQAAKSQQPKPAPAIASRDAPTAVLSTPSHLEKISPQALRESVVVLQEQLQEREARIEGLESEISTIGRDAPEKLQARDTEIGWLRELLGVRIDDLTDLVNNLQMEKFDRGAARNAAIRIKANLQMEQQEKDRVLHGAKPTNTPSSLPSLSDIQNFASPKAAQLTSAFNNWRKGGPPSLAGLREAVNSGTPSRPSPNAIRPDVTSRSSHSSTPNRPDPSNVTELKNPIAASAAANANKASGAHPFPTGLMTPPASNLRRTPSTGAASAETARPSTPVRPGTASSESPSKKTDPTTPPLTRKGDYDLDAELGPDRLEFEGSDYEYDDEPEASGDTTADTAERTALEPLGEVVSGSAAAD